MTLHEPTWDDARAAAYGAAAPLPPQSMMLTDALALTLAQPIVARMQVPAFDTAVMDGWAVAGPGPWTVRGRVLAGSVPPTLESGSALEIATGAAVPAGTTAVLRREWGTTDDIALRATHAFSDGLDIRRAGDEATTGDVLAEIGTVITPPLLGLAALVGNDEVVVHRRPRVSALILGDEIITQGIPSTGKVRDALGVQLLYWSGTAERTDVQYVPDTLTATVAAIASSTADIIFTTGGTARGPVDHMHAALAELDATLIIDEVKVRPGHPMLLAVLPSGQFVVGLPGNPLAAVAGFLTLAAPLLARMANQPMRTLRSTRTTAAIKAPPGERRLIPAVQNGPDATPTEYWGSAMLRGIAASDCFLVSPPGGAAAGDSVQILDLPW